jgi:hypothetical protein
MAFWKKKIGDVVILPDIDKDDFGIDERIPNIVDIVENDFVNDQTIPNNSEKRVGDCMDCFCTFNCSFR